MKFFKKSKKRLSTSLNSSLKKGISIGLVGDGYVGKTSTLIHFLSNFDPTMIDKYSSYSPTILDIHKFNTSAGEVKFYDVSSSEQNYMLRKEIYEQCNFIIICYSLDQPNSLFNIRRKWVPELSAHNRKIPFIILACKSDLMFSAENSGNDNEKHFQIIDEGRKESKALGAVGYFLCNIKTLDTINLAFSFAIDSSSLSLR